MVLLGVLTNGKVLLCDSVDRSWYNGGQRLKIVDLSDIMEYMFPCTSFSESMPYPEHYFKSGCYGHHSIPILLDGQHVIKGLYRGAATAVTSKYTKLVNSFLDFLENSL